MPSCGSGCGWSYAGPTLVPCGLPSNGEGGQIKPAGAPCGGAFDPSCACAGCALEQCQRLCEDHADCDAISWGEGSRDCYMKSSPQACDHVAAGTLCPTLAAGYQYHMRCGCSIGGTFADGQPKIVGCPPEWGRGFLLALALLTVAYVGIGSGLRHRAGSRGAEMLPHRAEWRQLGGLVRDGVEFSRARLRGKGGASREPLRQQKSPTKKRRQHKDRRREEPDRPEPPEPSRQQPDVAAVAEAEVQAPSGTAAGDGGRWVRLPG